ncbi:MAG: hypothetical protein MJ082_04025 [Clostridia bacterium]|nr:hypothetical protein [Clostridia bacterium]
MGFGVLTVACILLLNISWFSYTDALCAILLLWGLNKLRVFNRPMRGAFGFALGFLAIGVLELVSEGAALFGAENLFGDGAVAVNIARHLALQGTIIFSLLGVRSLALEVGIRRLASRCERTLVFPVLLALLCSVLELPVVAERTDVKTTAVIAGVTVLLFVAAQILHALTFFRANMSICMPEDVDMPEKPSRFKFVNDFRARADAKEKELTDYKIAKMREKRRKKK